MPPARASEPAQTPRWNPTDVLLAAAGFGVLAGGIEALAAALRRGVLHETLFVGPEMVWQLPLTDAAIYLLAALLCLAVSVLWTALREPRVVVGIFGGLVAFSALLLTEKIHITAEAVLAAGIGVVTSRLLARNPDRVRRIFRLGTPIALVGLAAAGVIQARVLAATERRRIAALPTPAAGRPNILLLVLDTVRSWSLSLYGYGRPTTPGLQRWAAGGVLFQRALAPAPWTTLSHAVMFTGRYPTELSVSWRTPYDGAFPTLAKVLRDAGYATAGFAGNYLNVGRGTGIAGGFLHYEDYPGRPVPLLRSTTLFGRLLRIDRVKALIGRRRTNTGLDGADVNRRFLRWLDHADQRPWFAFLNYFDAHGPYVPPAPFETMYMGRADSVADRYWRNVQRAYGSTPVPVDVLAEEMDAYDGAITYLDQQIDSLLKTLGARGVLGNTIVVVTSDHGELFGEHGVIGHGNNLFLPVLHVPLLIIAPGRAPERVVVPSLTSLRDLPATLLELAGVPGPGLPGHSMTGLWGAGAAGVVDTLFASVDYNWLIPRWPPSPVLRGPMRTVVLDSLQYIRNGDGVEELYDLSRDSWEIRNLVSAPGYAADLARYRLALGELIRTARAPDPSR